MYGALGSIDEAAVLSGGNIAAIGDGSGNWELFQFRDAELVSPDVWGLGHLLRGQQGTDAVVLTVWPAGSTVILFDGALAQIDLPSTLRGVDRRYRIGPASKPVDHAAFIEIHHTATSVGLRPYAPAHLRSNPDGAGGYTMSWVRRSRIDGDNWELPDVPLGETVESYRVQVLKDGGVRREETVSAPSFNYDAAMQATDGVTVPFSVDVAQISDRFGFGATARIVING